MGVSRPSDRAAAAAAAAAEFQSHRSELELTFKELQRQLPAYKSMVAEQRATAERFHSQAKALIKDKMIEYDEKNTISKQALEIVNIPATIRNLDKWRDSFSAKINADNVDVDKILLDWFSSNATVQVCLKCNKDTTDIRWFVYKVLSKLREIADVMSPKKPYSLMAITEDRSANLDLFLRRIFELTRNPNGRLLTELVANLPHLLAGNWAFPFDKTWCETLINTTTPLFEVISIYPTITTLVDKYRGSLEKLRGAARRTDKQADVVIARLNDINFGRQDFKDRYVAFLRPHMILQTFEIDVDMVDVQRHLVYWLGDIREKLADDHFDDDGYFAYRDLDLKDMQNALKGFNADALVVKKVEKMKTYVRLLTALAEAKEPPPTIPNEVIRQLYGADDIWSISWKWPISNSMMQALRTLPQK
ncbi:hypothetical protein B0T17DRAFT_409731 [Bombardia bombarda]|uniref:Uncharacterized protein n=1 Tax=Bombardia bombarda TaxID=252184 RepID=A0AA39WCF2_9PEZI|nr:hypothetical protein B0T17DRAFT_409731 [Bombardia bombarda]